MKKLLTIFLALIFTLLCVVAGTVALWWWKPELLINEKNVRWALRFAPAGTEVRWSSFAWSFSSEGFWSKSTRLEMHGFCFNLAGVKGCAPLVRLDASFTIAGFHPRLTRLGSAKLDVNDLTMHAPPPDAPIPQNASPLPDLRPPSFTGIIPKEFDLDQIGEVDLQVRQFILQGQKGALRANVRLRKQASAPGTARFSLMGMARQDRSLSITLNGRGEILAHEQKFAWKGQAGGVISGWRVAFPFEGVWSDRIKLHGHASAMNGKEHYASPVSLDWQSSRILFGVTSLSIEKLWPQKRLSLNDCRLESVLERSKGYPKKNELHCDLSLLALKRGALLPPLTAKMVAELDLSPARADAIDVDFKLHELGNNDYLSTKIEAAASGRYLPSKGEPEGTPKLELTVNLHVPELQAWKRSLDHTPFSIPAPFRTLEGPGALDISLEKESREAITAKAELTTDFHGGRQVFVTRHLAHITLHNPWAGKKSINVDDRSELTDVALEAPPLKLESPPQFLPDRRFEDTRKKAQAVLPKSSIPIHWKLALVTKSPFRIRTNLLKSEVPVALDLQFADDADMGGDVRILEMPLQVFKKKAEVMHINVAFHDGSKQGEVDGLAIYKNSEVTVQILLLGSTDKPRVEFVSNPPLSRSQIVSVLLFNKSVSELTDEEAASAGSLSQATADGAMGLFSLLFLSSTPIESISYDPVSQTYAARMRLGDKTTLSIGSNFDHERQVALRRRLGGRWAIRTELHDAEGKPDVLLTLVEWFKRF